jgi:hypothetical protein
LLVFSLFPPPERAQPLDVHAVDAEWTPNTVSNANRDNGKGH